ncbi:MAG: hypothetical protein WC975_15105 [Phycisphaerae bacterium]
MIACEEINKVNEEKIRTLAASNLEITAVNLPCDRETGDWLHLSVSEDQTQMEKGVHALLP